MESDILQRKRDNRTFYRIGHRAGFPVTKALGMERGLIMTIRYRHDQPWAVVANDRGEIGGL